MSDWIELTLPTRHYARWRQRPAPRATLLVLHGYAENPDLMMEHFDVEALADVDLVVPLGAHHFYNRQGHVVGSWMTRFHREHQVDEFLAYMEAVGEATRRSEVPTYVFGFSQGAAAAYRVAVLSTVELRRVFCLGGDMPPEVQAALASRPPRPIDLLSAETDDRMPLATMEADAARLAEAGWPHSLHRVRGGHEIRTETVQWVADRIHKDLD